MNDNTLLEILPLLASYGIAGISLFFFTIWVVSRSHVSFLYFALGGLLWVVVALILPQNAMPLWRALGIIYLCVSPFLLYRFTAALNRVELLNTELQRRLQETQRDLRDRYGELQALETQRALEQERERIYRDLHDDIGAGLLTLIHRTSESENRVARQALQHLRDIVSINTRGNISLADTLADLCTECQHHAENRGIDLDWQQPESLPRVVLSESTILALRRGFRTLFAESVGAVRSLAIELQLRDEMLDIAVTGERLPGESLADLLDAHLRSAVGFARWSDGMIVGQLPISEEKRRA